MLEPGPPRGKGRGGSLSHGLRIQGPHQLISKFLFIASLDVFKEHLNTSSLKGSESASRFRSPRLPYFLPLPLALITDTRVLILKFCL